MPLTQGFFVSGVSFLGVWRASGLVEMMPCKVLRNVQSGGAIVSKETDTPRRACHLCSH